MVRGCGNRSENSLYVCVESNPYGIGKEIEYFLIDPVVVWKEWREAHEGKALRGTMIAKGQDGTNHLVMGYGKSYYPFIPDVVEETRRYGISKKIPINFNPSRLTPGKSKLIFMHPRGSPQFEYDLEVLTCPKGNDYEHDCIGSLWQLSTARSFKPYHQVQRLQTTKLEHRVAKISTPSVDYQVYYPKKQPIWKNHYYDPGLFLQFPRFHFEYINSKGQIPSIIKDTIKEAGYNLEVLPE